MSFPIVPRLRAARLRSAVARFDRRLALATRKKNATASPPAIPESWLQQTYRSGTGKQSAEQQGASSPAASGLRMRPAGRPLTLAEARGPAGVPFVHVRAALYSLPSAIARLVKSRDRDCCPADP